MAGDTQGTTGKPGQILVTLLLEGPATINYRLLSERVGKFLEFNLEAVKEHKPEFPMILPAGGDLIFGMDMDFAFPERLDSAAQHAYWWPNALADIARHTSHVFVSCSWSKHSRLDAHIRHLALVCALVDQLPVIGVVWRSVLMQPDTLKGEFARLQKGELPFSAWVLIQFSKQPNGNILISTLGMRDFECMEIETESSLPLDQTYDLVRKFGSYILAKGPVVKDGETMGLSEEQRIKVRHTRSFRPDVNENVYWLELTDKPSVEKPKGFFSTLFGSNRKQ